MKKIIASGIVFLSSFTVANAAVLTGTGSVTNVNQLSSQIKNYLNLAVELMLAAAVVYVIWSSFKFVTAGGDEEGRKTAQSGIVYGVIGVAVMLSVWGLIALVTGSTGLGTGAGVVPPTVL